MGGFNSGGHNRRHAVTIEDCRRLEAGKMQRAGAFAEGYSGGWKWTSKDGDVNTIRNRMVAGLLRLEFRFRRIGGPWQEVEQLIAIRYQPCQFGGETALFVCPVCNAPRRYLYSADARFLCRGCYRLPYASQRERDADRSARKARKLRRQLGVDVSPEMPIWPKPKGMHWRTFEAIAQEIHRNEQVLMQHMGMLLGRIKRPPRNRASTRSFWT
ncbi:MAG: hypothetical protein ABNH53_01930 [Henriciella sp.]|jgi:hypothetical protein